MYTLQKHLTTHPKAMKHNSDWSMKIFLIPVMVLGLILIILWKIMGRLGKILLLNSIWWTHFEICWDNYIWQVVLSFKPHIELKWWTLVSSLMGVNKQHFSGVTPFYNLNIYIFCCSCICIWDPLFHISVIHFVLKI